MTAIERRFRLGQPDEPVLAVVRMVRIDDQLRFLRNNCWDVLHNPNLRYTLIELTETALCRDPSRMHLLQLWGGLANGLLAVAEHRYQDSREMQEYVAHRAENELRADGSAVVLNAADYPTDSFSNMQDVIGNEAELVTRPFVRIDEVTPEALQAYAQTADPQELPTSGETREHLAVPAWWELHQDEAPPEWYQGVRQIVVAGVPTGEAHKTPYELLSNPNWVKGSRMSYIHEGPDGKLRAASLDRGEVPEGPKIAVLRQDSSSLPAVRYGCSWADAEARLWRYDSGCAAPTPLADLQPSLLTSAVVWSSGNFPSWVYSCGAFTPGARHTAHPQNLCTLQRGLSSSIGTGAYAGQHFLRDAQWDTPRFGSTTAVVAETNRVALLRESAATTPKAPPAMQRKFVQVLPGAQFPPTAGMEGSYCLLAKSPRGEWHRLSHDEHYTPEVRDLLDERLTTLLIAMPAESGQAPVLLPRVAAPASSQQAWDSVASLIGPPQSTHSPVAKNKGYLSSLIMRCPSGAFDGVQFVQSVDLPAQPANHSPQPTDHLSQPAGENTMLPIDSNTTVDLATEILSIGTHDADDDDADEPCWTDCVANLYLGQPSAFRPWAEIRQVDLALIPDGTGMFTLEAVSEGPHVSIQLPGGPNGPWLEGLSASWDWQAEHAASPLRYCWADAQGIHKVELRLGAALCEAISQPDGGNAADETKLKESYIDPSFESWWTFVDPHEVSCAGFLVLDIEGRPDSSEREGPERYDVLASGAPVLRADGYLSDLPRSAAGAEIHARMFGLPTPATAQATPSNAATPMRTPAELSPSPAKTLPTPASSTGSAPSTGTALLTALGFVANTIASLAVAPGKRKEALPAKTPKVLDK